MKNTDHNPAVKSDAAKDRHKDAAPGQPKQEQSGSKAKDDLPGAQGFRSAGASEDTYD